MRLTRNEQDMLDGKRGEAKRIAMEKLIKFGIAVNAAEMAELSNVHAGQCTIMPRSTPDYAKYEFGQTPLYQQFIHMGATVTDDPTCICSTDPWFVQLDRYEEEGYPWRHSRYQMPRVIYEAQVRGYDVCKKMGFVMSQSCTPQFNTVIPKRGEYIVSVESSYATYANSTLGARANRENTATLIYAAITGVHPKYGTMLDAHRRAQVMFTVSDEVLQSLGDLADWTALGATIALKANNRVPAVLNLPTPISNDIAKVLTAAASPGMNDPMMHLIGISPDSPTLEAAFDGAVPTDVERFTVTLADLKATYRLLTSATSDKVDIVHVGCPHLTYSEIHQIARLIEGKRVNGNVHFWVQTDTPSYYMAYHYGDAQVIEKAGGKIYHSTCFGFHPLREWGNDLTIATNSFKNVKLFGGQGQGWFFGTLPDLINAAVTGKFVSTRWA